MRWDKPHPIEKQTPGPTDADLCLLAGGHFWAVVPIGESGRCENCGARGARNVPSVDLEADPGDT